MNVHGIDGVPNTVLVRLLPVLLKGVRTFLYFGAHPLVTVCIVMLG